MSQGYLRPKYKQNPKTMKQDTFNEIKHTKTDKNKIYENPKLNEKEHDFENNKMKKERKLIYNPSKWNPGGTKTPHTLVNNE